MELLRRFATSAPELRDFGQDKPTLLVSWWCTGYAITIIFFRVCGRYVRTEKIYAEDAIMMLAIIPLLMRTALVHVVLIYGTNNTQIEGLTETQIHQRELGSKLVLAARIFYTTYIWAIKYSISLYLRSLTLSIWRTSHHRLLRHLHILLLATYLATIISDLAACHPFSNYYLVTPSPAPQCRLAYAHLLTHSTLNILTSLALILFPIPMIFSSTLPRQQKLSIVFRMALPFFGIALTTYQIPTVIAHHGAQQFRSLVASFDILLATSTSNAVVLGSLLQDRGYKKEKYKYVQSVQFSKRGAPGPARWGSDEDLMQEVGKEGMEISLQDMKVAGGRGDGIGRPAKAKFPEIRVNSTWEVQVDSNGDRKRIEKE